jgi:hypothetical protein
MSEYLFLEIVLFTAITKKFKCLFKVEYSRSRFHQDFMSRFMCNICSTKIHTRTVSREKLEKAARIKSVKLTRTQFHQHITHVFFVRKFVQSQNITRKKAFVQKGAQKTLMKFTPG